MSRKTSATATGCRCICATGSPPSLTDAMGVFHLPRQQMANQMVNCVLQKMDGHWLCITFMDGTNDVYRYSYNTEGVGLEGYDHSCWAGGLC